MLALGFAAGSLACGYLVDSIAARELIWVIVAWAVVAAIAGLLLEPLDDVRRKVADRDAGKALLLSAIARIAFEEGLAIDVCSHGELQTALRAGVPAGACILHGCFKTGEELDAAVACGVPVLVTERCGIAPLVRDRAGLVVPCEVEALRSALVRLIADQDLRDRLRAGTAEVRRELAWDEPVAQMERLYMECVQARRSPGP